MELILKRSSIVLSPDDLVISRLHRTPSWSTYEPTEHTNAVPLSAALPAHSGSKRQALEATPNFFITVDNLLSPHPARQTLRQNAKSMSLQFMHDSHQESFNNLFGRIVGKRKPTESVRIMKLLRSQLVPERPIIPCIASDYCEAGTRDLNGETTVHWSCRSGEVHRLAKLIEDGCNLNTRNKKGETPLHIACFSGSRECCKLLLKFGADVDILDDDKWGAIHWAVEQNHLECVKALVVHNCNFNLRLPSAGKTPLDLAVQGDASAKRMMDLLMKQEQDGEMVPKATKTVNRALARFVPKSKRDAKVDDQKKIASIKAPPAFRHLKAARLAARGRKEHLSMAKFLVESIHRKSFRETAEIKTLIQQPGYAAMVFFLRSCGAGTMAEAVSKEQAVKRAYASLLADDKGPKHAR